MPDEKVTTLEALTKRGQPAVRELGEPEADPSPTRLRRWMTTPSAPSWRIVAGR